MNDLPQEPVPHPTLLLVVCLQVLSILLASIGTVAAALLLAVAAKEQELTVTGLLSAIAWLLAGWAGAFGLWAISWLVRREGRTSPPRPEPFQAPPAVLNLANLTRPKAPGQEQELLRQVLAELASIHEDLLLDDQQRRRRAGQRRQEAMAKLDDQTRQAIGRGDLESAQQTVAQLAQEGPQHPQLEELRRGIAQLRAAQEKATVERETRRAEDLMSAAAFGEALKAAQELTACYPSSSEAAALLARVQREAAAFEIEQRRRLYNEIQRSAEGRQWRSALAAARRLAQEYPASPEAQALAGQMRTLEENARIEEVRQLRDQIRQFIERRRYAHAVEIAEDLIRRFPDTQAAAELREQIDRLRDLAKGK